MSEHAQEIKDKVINIIAEQFGVSTDEVELEHNLIADLNADSLDSVELIMELEDEFDMSIDDEKAEKIETVQGIIDAVTEAQVA